MSIQRKSNNKRLLDALDHIDGRYVAELVEGLRLPKESAADPAAKRSIRTSLKYAALIAACALILGAAIPVAGSLIRNLTSGMAAAGGESLGENEASSELLNSEIKPTEEGLQLKEQTGDAFDGSPLFWVVNVDGYSKPTGEVFTADGKQIDLCHCKSDPCTCYADRFYVTVWGSQLQYCTEQTDSVTFSIYDASDPAKVKYIERTTEMISGSTHDIYAYNGTPYYYAYSKSDDVEHPGLSIITLSDLPVEGGLHLLSFPEYGSMKDKGEILHIDMEKWPYSVYFGIKDKKTNAITQIALLTYDVVDGKATDVYKVLFEVDNEYFFGVRDYLKVADDGSVHYFREELNDESEYGYSLYQYIWREGAKVEKVLRAKNVCDYIVTDGYIYYTVNDPADLRELPNYDVSGREIYRDMTGGKIYRLPAFEVDYKPMLALTLGEEYYLYGCTEKNMSEHKVQVGVDEYIDRGDKDNNTFVQGTDGGIAIWANKKVGDKFIAVNLLIGDSEKGMTMTELEGSYYWGYWVYAGGGPNVNWEYRP